MSLSTTELQQAVSTTINLIKDSVLVADDAKMLRDLGERGKKTASMIAATDTETDQVGLAKDLEAESQHIMGQAKLAIRSVQTQKNPNQESSKELFNSLQILFTVLNQHPELHKEFLETCKTLQGIKNGDFGYLTDKIGGTAATFAKIAAASLGGTAAGLIGGGVTLFFTLVATGAEIGYDWLAEKQRAGIKISQQEINNQAIKVMNVYMRNLADDPAFSRYEKAIDAATKALKPGLDIRTGRDLTAGVKMLEVYEKELGITDIPERKRGMTIVQDNIAITEEKIKQKTDQFTEATAQLSSFQIGRPSAAQLVAQQKEAQALKSALEEQNKVKAELLAATSLTLPVEEKTKTVSGHSTIMTQLSPSLLITPNMRARSVSTDNFSASRTGNKKSESEQSSRTSRPRAGTTVTQADVSPPEPISRSRSNSSSADFKPMHISFKSSEDKPQIAQTTRPRSISIEPGTRLSIKEINQPQTLAAPTIRARSISTPDFSDVRKPAGLVIHTDSSPSGLAAKSSIFFKPSGYTTQPRGHTIKHDVSPPPTSRGGPRLGVISET